MAKLFSKDGAKYYIYRNLRTGTWSVRHRGKVIAHLDKLATVGPVHFKVSQSGRNRVLEEGRKNVHAYVVAEQLVELPLKIRVYNQEEVYYNPYELDTFTKKVSGKHLTGTYNPVIMQDNKVYILGDKT